MAGECEISDLYDASDRRRFYIPCPHCGDFGLLKYETMLAPSPATANRAAFVCEGCGGVLEEAHSGPMVSQRPLGPDMGRRTARSRFRRSFRQLRSRLMRFSRARAASPDASQAMPSGPPIRRWRIWTDIWERGQAARADPAMLKVFTQQDLGEPYEPKNDTPDWEKLLGARKAWKRGVVPWPGAVLTGFIDVQGNQIRMGACGRGVRAFKAGSSTAASSPMTTRKMRHGRRSTL